MKVLAVNKFYYLKGGSEAYYFSLAKLLEGKSIEVIPFSMKDERNYKSSYDKYFINNIDYEKSGILQKLRNSLKIIYSLEAKRNAGDIIRSTTPDIAHLHIFQHQFSPSILSEIKKYGIPIVNTVHDLKPLCPNYKMLCKEKICEKCNRHRYYNCLVNKCSKNSLAASFVNTVEMYLHWLIGSYNFIDVFITPSRFFRTKFIEYGYSPEKVIHIPNFVDISLYKENYSSENYFIYFGRLSEEKGIYTLLKAMHNVRKSNLYIIGDGPLRDELQNIIGRDNLQNVKLLGYKSGEDLRRLIENGKFTILPSEWYENSPMSVFESMSCGKPVIGSNIGGIPELIEHHKDGLIFQPGNAEQLSEQINYLLDNPSKTIQLGREAREKIEKEYNKELHFKRITGIYNDLLSKYGRSVWKD